MISHKHKCIFIHIAKCAGTSIEHAFGIDVNNHSADENDYLFGWDVKNKLWLQHATPQQLIDLGYISIKNWNSYYKFIIYRNSWDRAYSDYLWMKDVRNVEDSFNNFINKKGKYKKILNDNSSSHYVGDHLYLQKDYFFLNDERINYNAEINYSELRNGFKTIINDLGLKNNFFDHKLNLSKSNKKKHYSLFYNQNKKRLVEKTYEEDIIFFNFKFEDKKNILQKIFSNF